MARNHDSNSNQQPFRVQGIALVVDQKGVEAKMALRYPSSPADRDDDTARGRDLFFRMDPRQMAKLFRPKATLCNQPMTLTVGGTIFCCRAVLFPEGCNSSNNILPSTAAAPTVDDHQQTSTDATTTTTTTITTTEQAGDDNKRVTMFSIIVALVPRGRGAESSMPIFISSWYEDKELNNNHNNANTTAGLFGSSPQSAGDSSSGTTTARRMSTSFLAVVRVHLSLARLCPILEREERRCQYMTLQTLLILSIRKQILRTMNQNHNQHNQTTSTSSAGVASANPSSTPSVGVSSKKSTKPPRSTAVAASSSSVAPGDPLSTSQTPSNHGILSSMESAEREQEILETIMAAPPPVYEITGGAAGALIVPPAGTIPHKGNLARELVQFYHALSRNDEADDEGSCFSHVATTPSRVLGAEGVLYINGHIAVAVEPVSSLSLKWSPGGENQANIVVLGARHNRTFVRPYQTLLFPHMSRKDLLESLSSSTTVAAPRRVQQFLLSANPQKPLSDIATDSNLALQSTLDVASYLVGQGVAVPSPVISRHSRLVCSGIQAIQNAALSFSYAFGPPPDVDLFALVAFLTTASWTLGEAMTALVSSADTEAQYLRAQLRRRSTSLSNRSSALRTNQSISMIWMEGSHNHHHHAPAAAPSFTTQVGGVAVNAMGTSEEQNETQQAVELEEILYKMVVWLCGRGVLVQLQEYLVEPLAGEQVPFSWHNPRSSVHEEQSTTSLLGGEKKVDATFSNTAATSDDVLLQELRSAQCLTGRASLHAIGWRLGVDMVRLRGFVARNNHDIRLVTRLATPGDDWTA